MIHADSCPTNSALRTIRNGLKSGIVLETRETCEKNIIYHMTEDTEQGDKCGSSYCEASYLAPVILPHHQHVSVLVLSYKWKNVTDFDCYYFIENWGLLR